MDNTNNYKPAIFKSIIFTLLSVLTLLYPFFNLFIIISIILLAQTFSEIFQVSLAQIQHIFFLLIGLTSLILTLSSALAFRRDYVRARSYKVYWVLALGYLLTVSLFGVAYIKTTNPQALIGIQAIGPFCSIGPIHMAIVFDLARLFKDDIDTLSTKNRYEIIGYFFCFASFYMGAQQIYSKFSRALLTYLPKTLLTQFNPNNLAFFTAIIIISVSLIAYCLLLKKRRQSKRNVTLPFIIISLGIYLSINPIIFNCFDYLVQKEAYKIIVNNLPELDAMAVITCFIFPMLGLFLDAQPTYRQLEPELYDGNSSSI